VTGDWSLGRRIAVLSAAGALLLAAIAVAAAVVTIGNRSATNRVIGHVDPARSGSERLLSALYRQQSAVRTYALTGLPSDLQTYHDALTDERSTAASTRSLLAGETSMLAALDKAVAASDAWRSKVVDAIVARVRAGGPSMQNATPTQQTRTLFGAATAAIGDLNARLTAAREAASRRADRTGDQLLALLVAAAGLVVVGGIMLAFLLRRLVIAPVLDLAGEVRRVAEGDYQHRIYSEGPPELRRLARDVDGMRGRIAEDLYDVEEARQQIQEVNQRLEDQAEELTRSNRDLEQFAYVASHDLQEPLRKVASFCQLLQRRYAGQLDERADQYIAFAVDGAQRMQRLINDLLSFSRIGRMANSFQDVDLNKVARDAVAQFDAQREETGAEIVLADLPVVQGEEPLLGAAFANLVGNAIKFRHPDRAPIVRISAETVGADYEFSVQDNGIGIAPEFADKVFVIFQRLHAKETYPGTGIGLAIVKKIVEYHGGRIRIDPTSSEGTLFRFTLPVPKSAQAEARPSLEETVA
jgi:signal transduction histidine kinase